jgi:hypothetical protein
MSPLATKGARAVEGPAGLGAAYGQALEHLLGGDHSGQQHTPHAKAGSSAASRGSSNLSDVSRMVKARGTGAKASAAKSRAALDR